MNIYRLYKAELSTPALARFLGTPEHAGNFRAVQVLLAFVIAAPDFAKSVVTVLDGFAATDSATLATLPTTIPIEERQPTWRTTLDALVKFARTGTTTCASSSCARCRRSSLVTRCTT